MNTNEQELANKYKNIKLKIEKLIESGLLEDARELLENLDLVIPGDVELYSMKAIISIIEGKLEDAKTILLEGLQLSPFDFDLLYNIAYVYEQQLNHQIAYEFYNDAINVANEEKKEIAEQALKSLQKRIHSLKYRKNLVFFVKEGMDSFLNDIIKSVSDTYRTKKIIVKDYGQIMLGMNWADICWFEWCDELLIAASKLEIAQNKTIICRLHSYEAFTPFINQVNWSVVDKVIFVAEHIKDYVLANEKNLFAHQTIVISNGINLQKYKFKERKPGYKIAYVGYINYKKGPMLLLHAFKAIYDYDKRYKLYIAGQFQDPRYVLYFQQMIKEMGLENNIFFEGWQENIDEWLEDKNYILSSSILESQHLSIMEAMAKGIKPIIHNFVGAKKIFPTDFIWNTIDEAVELISSKDYFSQDYFEEIKNNYSIEKSTNQLLRLIQNLIKNINVLNKNVQSNLSDEILTYEHRLTTKINAVGNLVHYVENTKNVKVSIVTPMFNCNSYLEAIFKSISEQSLAQKIEWILVDDCSNDETLKNACILARKNQHAFGALKIYSLRENSGAAVAIDFGIRNTSSDIVAWISADDLYVDPDKIETDYKLIKKEKADIVFSNNILIGENLDNSSLFTINNNIISILTGDKRLEKLAFLTYNNPINGSSLVFSKATYLETGGFDTQLINVDGDWDFLTRAILQRRRFVIDNKKIFYRTHQSQTSKNSIKMLVGTSLTRIRILNFLLEQGLDKGFREYIQRLGILNNAGNQTLYRPIFSYNLLKGEKKYENQIENIEFQFGFENLKRIGIIAKDLEKSEAFLKFKKYTKSGE